MAELQPFEQIDAGGVDSRSNPINMPRNRCLRCLNWVPKQAGFWELRYGYTTVSMSSVTASAISGLFTYRTWDGHKYVLFIQGTTLNVLDTATGNVTTPTVHGAAVSSSAKGMGFLGNNRFHYGNGTDQKWFDSTAWRDSGLRAPTTAELANVVVTDGLRELTSAEASTITLTSAATGTFPTDTTGRLIYVQIFQISGTSDEAGPATIFVSSGRVKMTSGDKLTVANMPTGIGIKLIGGTLDGGNVAYLFTPTSVNITSLTRTSSTVVTVVATSHGLSNATVGLISGTNSTYDGLHGITVIDANTFSIRVPSSNPGGNLGAVGQAKSVAQTTGASIDIIDPTYDTFWQVNQPMGLPTGTIGGSTPGYAFYVCIYNPNGGGHVGNRVQAGGRYTPGQSYSPTPGRVNFHISGLPNYPAIDPEWVALVGRTGDGAAVPYPIADNALNWLTYSGPDAGNMNGIVVTGDPVTDGSHELPTRNGIIPSQCNMFCLAGDYAYAADTGSPFLRRSGSFADDRAGIFTGRPEQSWAADDIDTFPTAEAATAMFEVDQEVLMGTLTDCAISINSAGVQSWVGPFNVGIAGRRAGTKCGQHGFYWISGDKQLCTLQQGVPVAVSDEYQAAELSQIGDSFLSTVELVYYRNAQQQKDELRIEGQKQDGTPYTIIHDFMTREFYTAPGSIYGQGFSSQFRGPLGTAFTSGQVRDSSGLRIYAGSSTGQFYQMYAGADDVGNQYTADAIMLFNGGPMRPNVPFIDFYGDANIKITVGRNLQTSLATGAEWGFEPPNEDADVATAVPGSEQDFLYRVDLVPPEVQRLYLRFQLQSHSADGNLDLNSPPHLPLENYGRLYEFVPAMGDERDR